jgi:hypothetical protein
VFSAALFFAAALHTGNFNLNRHSLLLKLATLNLKMVRNDFVLKKEKKYFIQFPSPQEDNFYLVLDLPSKKQFNSVLTAKLIDKKSYDGSIADESTADTLSIYPVMNNGTGY